MAGGRRPVPHFSRSGDTIRNVKDKQTKSAKFKAGTDDTSLVVSISQAGWPIFNVSLWGKEVRGYMDFADLFRYVAQVCEDEAAKENGDEDG